MTRERDQAIAVNSQFFQTLLAAQIEQIDNKSRIVHFTAQATDKLHGGVDGAAGCQQIVNHQDFIAFFDRIDMDFQLIGAVLKLVAFCDPVTQRLLAARLLLRLLLLVSR